MSTEVILAVAIHAAWIGEWKAELRRRSEPEHSDEYILCAEHGHSSLSAAERAIPESTARAIMDALRAARIPAAVEPVMGLDGRTTTIEWATPWGGARYTWWGNPNRAWAPLLDVVDRIVALSPLPVPDGGP